MVFERGSRVQFFGLGDSGESERIHLSRGRGRERGKERKRETQKSPDYETCNLTFRRISPFKKCIIIVLNVMMSPSSGSQRWW